MRATTNGYILKEYGSWSVLTIAFIIGLGVSRSAPWQSGPVFLALALLINSKQAIMKLIRQPAIRKHLVVALSQITGAAIILVPVYRDGLPLLLPLLVIPAAYLLMNRILGEHHLVTEILGFALLSLAAVLAKFLVVQGVDIRLFAATALYFTAGVFKVKVALLGRTRDRILSILYVVLAVFIYHRFHIAFLILVPLIDTIAMAVFPYKVRVQTTGWIEVTKSLLFLALMVVFF